MPGGDRLFADLIAQAVAACGLDDWRCIEAHVQARIGALDVEQRRQLEDVFKSTIGFEEPKAPFLEN